VDTHCLIEKLSAKDASELLLPNEEVPPRLNGVDLPGLTAHFRDISLVCPQLQSMV
jgi:hypothetical protein